MGISSDGKGSLFGSWTLHQELSSRFGENIKRVRAAGGPDAIISYYDNLEESVADVPLENIVNYDETSFSDDRGKVKILVKRGNKHSENVLDSSKTSASVIMAGSTSGLLLTPYVVYKSKNLYPTWLEGGTKRAA